MIGPASEFPTYAPSEHQDGARPVTKLTRRHPSSVCLADEADAPVPGSMP